MSQKKKEFGDFQTPLHLGREIIHLLAKFIPCPDIVVEPTSGTGNFLECAFQQWGNSSQYFGFDLNEDYIQSSSQRFADTGCVHINKQDFFSYDWKLFFAENINKQILILGNPPWVTNSALGLMGSRNLPQKSNFQRFKGFDAKTGKANFDIAEWIIIKLVETVLGKDATLAMLCKTATARKVLTYFWKNKISIGPCRVYLIDSKKDFDVAVDACLLVMDLNSSIEDKTAQVYESLSHEKPCHRFGIHNGELIANLDGYLEYKDIDGFSNYIWRSGLKHDAAKVMELKLCHGQLINGFDEVVEIEKKHVYPLLKSSDLGNGCLIPRKYVIVTQTSVGESTDIIAQKMPKTWRYLCKYAKILDNRKSSIYNERPRFSIFGIGPYSFSKWKVAISGLYKNLLFSAVPSINGKPIMFDDTCYFIPCNSREEAEFWSDTLNSEQCQRFLHSLVFFDAKRPVNIDILRRINFAKLAIRRNKIEKARNYLQFAGFHGGQQSLLVFE